MTFIQNNEALKQTKYFRFSNYSDTNDKKKTINYTPLKDHYSMWEVSKVQERTRRKID